jgi:hypothetical protein
MYVKAVPLIVARRVQGGFINGATDSAVCVTSLRILLGLPHMLRTRQLTGIQGEALKLSAN